MTKLILKALLIIALLVPLVFVLNVYLRPSLAITPQCDNGLDDDGDGLRDGVDPDCTDPNDLTEGPSPGGGGAGCSGFIDCLSDIEVSGLKYQSEQGLVGRVLSDILPIILGLGGFLAVIIIIISGIQFITSSGNPEGAAAARGRLIFSIVGFVIIVLAFAILEIVDKLFLGDSGIV